MRRPRNWKRSTPRCRRRWNEFAILPSRGTPSPKKPEPPTGLNFRDKQPILLRAGSKVGQKGVHPLCFSKSAQVVLDQWFAERPKTSVCRELKRQGLRTCVNARKRSVVRRGRLSSQTSITSGEVDVNNDLSCGNSNERIVRSN